MFIIILFVICRFILELDCLCVKFVVKVFVRLVCFVDIKLFIFRYVVLGLVWFVCSILC